MILADEQISRTSSVHQFIYDGHPTGAVAAGPSSPDWTGDSNPYSRNNKYNNDYYDSYPTAQDKDYGYPSSAVKKPSKGKDSLWDFFENLFDKKNQWEEEIWDLIFHKEDDEKGHDYSAAGYHGDHHKKPLSKEKVYEKIKFLAIAATVLLIVLGGGILLAPLAIGKGRRSLSEFLPQNVDSTDIARLASNVLQAVQQYQQYN